MTDLRSPLLVLLALTTLMWVFPTHAGQGEDEDGFSARGELGLVVNRGNSDSESANTRLEGIYTQGAWSNETEAVGVYSRDSGQTSASRFTLGNRTDYSIDDNTYVAGVLRYDRDRFSSFRYQGSASVAYGYRVFRTDRHRLRAEIGPGYRISEVRDTGESDNRFIIRTFLDYRWTISESTELTNRFLVESGKQNTFAENGLALSVAINARVSLKTGLTVRHNTDVEPGRKKTDTLTTINLVYRFTDR
jgi:putative salt-induced outer membrane protein